MPTKNEREYRNLAELLAPQEDEKRVQGYATTFDQPYKLGGDDSFEFWEVVDRGAFNDTDMSDVIMQYNHEGRVFARTKNNTLTLRSDEHGLFIDADLGGTEIGRQLYEEIKNGLVDRMSWAFIVDPDGWEYDANTRTSTITKVSKVFDVSAVSIPANGDTEIHARSYFDGVIEMEQAERLAEEKRERQKQKIRILLEV